MNTLHSLYSSTNCAISSSWTIPAYEQFMNWSGNVHHHFTREQTERLVYDDVGSGDDDNNDDDSHLCEIANNQNTQIVQTQYLMICDLELLQ